MIENIKMQSETSNMSFASCRSTSMSRAEIYFTVCSREKWGRSFAMEECYKNVNKICDNLRL